MINRDLIFTAPVSVVISWLYLWLETKDIVLKVAANFCPYPEIIYPLMRPLCIYTWQYNFRIFISVFVIVNILWVVVKRFLSKLI